MQYIAYTGCVWDYDSTRIMTWKAYLGSSHDTVPTWLSSEGQLPIMIWFMQINPLRIFKLMQKRRNNTKGIRRWDADVPKIARWPKDEISKNDKIVNLQISGLSHAALGCNPNSGNLTGDKISIGPCREASKGTCSLQAAFVVNSWAHIYAELETKSLAHVQMVFCAEA